MKYEQFEFSVLVGGVPLKEFVDISNSVYLIVEPGTDYVLDFKNFSSSTVFIKLVIDGFELYWNYSCDKHITIEGVQDGPRIKPFKFSLSPLVPTREDDISSSRIPGGSIRFDVYNAVECDPILANTQEELPSEYQLNIQGRKMEGIGTCLGEYIPSSISPKQVYTRFGGNLITSHTFRVRSPFEMLAEQKMDECWKRWWNTERARYCSLETVEWICPMFSCGLNGTLKPSANIFERHPGSPTDLLQFSKKLKAIGLEVLRNPQTVHNVLVKSACENISNMHDCILYFHEKLSNRILGADYSSLYSPAEDMPYASWASLYAEKENDDQPTIVLQAFSDFFGIPLHVYCPENERGIRFKVVVFTPVKGRGYWALGYPIVHVDNQWYLTRRGTIEIEDEVEPESVRKKRKEEEQEKIAKELEEMQQEMEKKRRKLQELASAPEIKKEKQ